MSLLAESLSYTWASRGGNTVGLREFSGEFNAGVSHVICGPSGSGKSTLSYLLAGLIVPSHGRITLNGRELPSLRADIAYVFQFAENIFFEDSVGDEVRQWSATSRALDMSWFDQIGVDIERIRNQQPFHLSQGTGRLVSIALQMARSPRLLILDEPTIGLDWINERKILEALRSWMTTGRILVVVTHDVAVMRTLGGRAWVLKDGRLAWSGETAVLTEDARLLNMNGLDT